MSLPNQADTASPGQVIAGRFRVEAEIGEGGMARVFRVTDLATGGTFALKLLKPEAASEGEAVARLRREGEVLASLSSPAVVGIETFGMLDDGRLFLVMEYLQGETLGQRMRREGRIAPADLAPIVTGAAAGLQAAHEAGIVHRDLKPDNIFLEQRGPGEPVQVRLLDFGISKVYDQEERLTRTGQILGTPRYMAPEQLAADHDLDARVDIYALGVILYEALAGSPPFIATTPSDLIVAILHGKVTPLRVLCPHLPPAIEEVVARAMDRKREARFASAFELADAFLAATGSVRATPEPAESKRTSVLGGATAPEVAATPAAESLKIGTFSAVPGVAPPAEAPTARAAAAPQPTVPGRPSHRSAPAAAQGQAQSPPSPPVGSENPAGDAGTTPPGAQAPATAWPAEVSGEIHALPTRSRTWLWVLAALIAGAASAALALFLFERLQEPAEQTPPPVESSSPPGSDEAPAAITGEAAPPEGSATETGAGANTAGANTAHAATTEANAAGANADARSAAGVTPPLGREAPPEAAAPPSPTRRRTRRRPRHETRSLPADENSGNYAVPEPFVAETVDTAAGASERGGAAGPSALEEARAALRAGDPHRCLQLLRERRPRGSAAVRLEGDCYLRAGDRDEAVKTYERLCADYPAAAAAVRELVTSLGGVCP